MRSIIVVYPLLLTPAKRSKAELDAFEDLVRIGGEVTLNGLRNRIESAYFLALGKAASGEVVGIAALKKPNNNYRDFTRNKTLRMDNYQSRS